MKRIPILRAAPAWADGPRPLTRSRHRPAEAHDPWPCRTPSGRRAPRATARTAVAIIATAALALLAAACGGSPSSTGSGDSSNAAGSTNSHQVAFSGCMRSNGVTNYPDPNSSGVIPKESSEQLGVTSSRLQSAQNVCKHLLPNGGNGPNQAQLQRVRALSLRFAQCMRTHGIPLPDPDSSGRIPDPATVGVDQGSPQFEAANQACGRYRPPYMPSNAEYNAYAQTHGS